MIIQTTCNVTPPFDRVAGLVDQSGAMDSVHLDFSRGCTLAALRLDPAHRCAVCFVWPPLCCFFFFFFFQFSCQDFLNHRRSGLSASLEMLEDSAARGLHDDSWQEGVAAVFSEAWPSFTPVPPSPPYGLGHTNLWVLCHLCGQVRSQCWLIVTLK